MITIVGTLAAILTTTAMFPQALKIIRSRDVRSISLLMYITNTLGIVFWFIYGVLLSNVILIVTNIVAFIPAITIVVLKIRLANRPENVNPVWLSGANKEPLKEP